MLIDRNSNERIFNSQNEIAMFLKCNRGTIRKYRDTNKYFKDYMIKTIKL